jgi:large subunit ribosomal protein L17
MVAQLIRHERMETTLPKAKELRRLADKAVTLGKAGDLPARRAAASLLHSSAGTSAEVAKLFGELAARYAGREGGYTRVLASRLRPGDNARLAVIEFVDRPGEMRPARPGRGGGGGGGPGDASALPPTLSSLWPAAARAAVGGGAAAAGG